MSKRTAWNKGKNLSSQHKINLSLSHKGKKLSKNHKENIKKALTGRIIKWKEKISKGLTGGEFSLEHRNNISESLKGRKQTKEHIENVSRGVKKAWKTKDWSERNKKVSIANKGRIFSEEHKKKLSEWQIGEKSPHWRGGISNDPYSFEFNKELKEKIRKRDNYTCQLTGKTEKELGRRLTIHHIDYDKKNHAEDNLISLSRDSNTKVNYNRDDWTKYFKNKLKKYVNP